MNFNVADLPAVRAQLERDAAAKKDPAVPADNGQYARAPAASTAQPTGRPAAVQGGSR